MSEPPRPGEPDLDLLEEDDGWPSFWQQFHPERVEDLAIATVGGLLGAVITFSLLAGSPGWALVFAAACLGGLIAAFNR